MDLTLIPQYMPFVSGAALIAVLLLSDPARSTSRQKPPVGSVLVLAAFVGLMIAAAYKWQDSAQGAMPAATCFGIGVLAALMSDVVAAYRGSSLCSRSIPLAVGVIAASVCDFYLPGGALALVFGAASAAWLLRVNRYDENSSATVCSISLFAIVACNFLGAKGEAAASGTGSVYAVLATLSVAVASLFDRKTTTVSAVQIVVLGALWAGSSFLASQNLFPGRGSVLPFIGGGLIAFVVAWLVSSGGIRVGLAALIWLASATAAFSLDAGYGMAVALLAGVAMLAALGSRHGMLALAPLGALTLYRVLRESSELYGLSFDINQHYAMVGVLAGALLPLVCLEWLAATAKRGAAMNFVAGALWIVVFAFVPPIAAILLGSKGIVGFVVGSGVAPVIAALRGDKGLESLSISAGVSALVVGSFSWLGPLMEITREEKLRALAYVGGAVLVVSLIISSLSWGLSQPKKGVAA